MNFACRRQLKQLRAEVNGKFIPLFANAKLAIICFAPAPSTLPRDIDAWERCTSPVLLQIDGQRMQAILNPEAMSIAEALARSEQITAELAH